MLTHAQWLEDTFKRQDAIHAHAQTLRCPKCGSEQNQIMNQAYHDAPFEWRCRMCRHEFVSTPQHIASR